MVAWIRLFLICFAFSTIYCFDFEHLKPKTIPETQQEEVLNLLKRIIPDYVQKFKVEVNPSLGPKDKDTYHVEASGDAVTIIGTSGVAVASGFHHYLKYFCSCHISWEGANLNLPEVLPDANFTKTSNDRFRYYQNVCTTSYSFVWWDWNQWEKHIDWMALNSFNLVLAFNGQEAIWKRTYKKIGLTDEEIDEHFSGPAFLSWNRMGNIRNWGGPLSESWHTRSLKLQHHILDRMRNLGITPVLPAFAGHVPRGIERLYLNATLAPTSSWLNFNTTYCCVYILDPTDPLFKKIGSSFLSELIAEFGTNHVYNCDTFNEMQPTNSSLPYIENIGKSTFQAMTSADSQAIWIMQNWLFINKPNFWTKARARALLTAVPRGRMIILDLQAELQPLYQKFDSYYGQPYIWCMLHNFGGTLGMLGSAEVINNNVFKARKMQNTTLIGTGLTPEGINQNYVIYDLMSEMAWRRNSANLTTWFALYTVRRYGQVDSNAIAAWKILKSTVYNLRGKRIMGGYTVNVKPRLNLKPESWYNLCDLLKAWSHHLKGANVLRHSDLYLHDLVDLTRQVIQTVSDLTYKKFIRAFKTKQIDVFRDYASLFLLLIEDMEDILHTDKDFLLGPWLETAKAAAQDNEDEKLFEYNARNQITLWGPAGEIIDYANKQWSGLVSDFFLPRWTMFLKEMDKSLVNEVQFNQTAVISRMFKEIEEPFTFSRKLYPTERSGDPVETARRIHNKLKIIIECKKVRYYFSKQCILSSIKILRQYFLLK